MVQEPASTPLQLFAKVSLENTLKKIKNGELVNIAKRATCCLTGSSVSLLHQKTGEKELWNTVRKESSERGAIRWWSQVSLSIPRLGIIPHFTPDSQRGWDTEIPVPDQRPVALSLDAPRFPTPNSAIKLLITLH